MAAQYKTRCPHCQAQFRISEQHLKQARGQVRCGSCLQVFLATENLVQDEPSTAPARPGAATRPAKQPAPARPAASSAGPGATPEEWELPRETAPQPASRWTLDDEPGGELKGESRARPVEADAGNDTRVSLGSLELSDSFLSLDGNDDERLRDENFSDMAGAARGRQSDDSDEHWAEKLLEELDEEEKPSADPVSSGRRTLEESGSGVRQGGEGQARKAAAADDPEWAQEADHDFFAESGDDFPLAGEPPGADDDIEAIELPQAERKSVAPRIQVGQLIPGAAELLRWGALSALLLIVLGLQYLAFNFDTLARTPEWRDFYTTVCNALPCTLPDRSNLARVQGANLVVRQHPEFSQALVVDVLLFNKAEYQQPFPDLELGFTDLQGVPVAGRRFTPAEYLHGELARAALMPVDTPVHVSLEILDPGDNAVNYTLRFLPPTQKAEQNPT